LSLVLYTLYPSELLNQDTTRRFRYANDVCLYQASNSLDENVRLLAEDVRAINEWGAANKVAFAPEKLEMMHLTRQWDDYSPPYVVDATLTITLVTDQHDGV